MPDAQAEFREELALLRDRVIRSIREGLLSEVQQGYSIYSRLVDTVLHQLAYGMQDTASPKWVSFPRDYYPEWRWLQSDIRDFGDAAIDSGHAEMHVRTIDFISQLAYQSYQRSALGSLSTLLDLYPYLWGRLLQTNEWDAARYLLVSLQNLVDYQIGAPNGGVSSADTSQAITFSMRTFVQLLKVAIDAEDITAFREAADYFHAILSYREGGAFGKVPELRQAAWLGLAAWVLRSKKEKLNRPGDVPSMLSRLLDEVNDQDFWQAYGRARAESYGGSMYWDRWELELLPPMQVGILTFGQFLDQAAALKALQSDTAVALPAEPTRDDADLARALSAAIDQVEQKDWANEVSADLVNGAGRQLLRSRLNELVAAERLRWQNELRLTPLEQSRVDAFFETFEQTLLDNDESRLTKYLVRDETIEKPEGALGINVLVPKEFFVSTYVHADPGSLGKDFALSMMRAENQYLLGHLKATAKYLKITPPEDLPRELESRTQEDVDRWLVVAINPSWQFRRLLTLDDEVSQQSGSMPLVTVVYTDNEESACALVDLGKCGHAARDISAYSSEEWRRLVKVGVAGSVQPYSESDEGSKLGSEAKAHVRMYERLHWTDGAPGSVTWFEIEEP
jgi:hypothetical protein